MAANGRLFAVGPGDCDADFAADEVGGSARGRDTAAKDRVIGFRSKQELPTVGVSRSNKYATGHTTLKYAHVSRFPMRQSRVHPSVRGAEDI